MFKQVILICALHLTWTAAQYETCKTPKGTEGFCKPIQQCPEMMAKLNRGATREIKQYICNKAQQTVCCPVECYTPEGKPGECTSIEKCDKLRNIFFDSSKLPYIRNSICSSGDGLICCGPPPSPVVVENCQSQVSWFPPNPATKCCGYDSSSEPRIVGGSATAIDQFPWLVLLEYNKHNNKTGLLCGGALISNRYVLTAAHCVGVINGQKPLRVRLGEYDISNEGPDSEYKGDPDRTDGAFSIGVEEIIAHPNYKTNQNNQSIAGRDDIALIRLKEAAPFTYFIRPICLPESDVLGNSRMASLDTVVAGWGKVAENQYHSQKKQQVKVPLVDMMECQTEYKRRVNPHPILWSNQLCAGGEKGRDSCNGDSGGPLMEINSVGVNRFHQTVGIVSFGVKRCGTEGMPGVYTNVYSYNNWIRSNMRP